MSLPVNPDGSTQPTLTFTTVSTPETLNIWQRNANNIYNTDTGNVGIGTTTNINFKLKVNGSVNATAFNGDGANITNVPFSTITGKPTSYQADWTTTIINKPSTFPADMTNIYTKTETNNLLDTKQAIINTYSITGGTGGSLSFTSGTLTLAVPNNYTQNMSISNLITPTSFIYKGTELSTTIEPLQNIWTKIGNNIYNTAQYNGKVGIGITNPSTMLEIARLDVSANKIKFGHEGRYAVNQLFCNFFFRFITSHTASDEIAYFGYVDSYEDPLNRTMVLGITRTTLNMTGDIYASGNVGIGVSASATYKCNINGSLNATSFFQNGTQIDFNSYATNNNLTTNYYNKTETNNLLSAKDAILSFTSPLVRTTNTITFNESAITTLTNFYNKNDADNRYLQLSGGTLTGNLQISKSNPILTIRAGGESETAILYISTPFNSTSALKTAIISEGSTGWSRSKLHFCLNNTPTGAPGTTNWNLSTYTTTIADARMTIIPAGNVGISNTNPIARLHITETTGTTSGANSGTIILDHNNHGGASCITFRSAINRGSDYGYIQYQDSSIIDGAGESAKLIIGTQNDNDDDILLLPSGNVGIATTNTSSNKLYVNGSAYINGLLTINNDILLNRTNGHIQFGATNGNNLALPSGDGFFSSSALAGDMVLRSINRLHLLSGSGASAITINTNNNVGIGITNSFAPLCIGSPLVNGSDGHLVLSKRNLAGNAFRNFRMGIDDNFFFCIGDFGFGVSGNNWRPSDFTINYLNGNIGVGTSNQSFKFSVNGSINSTSLWQNGTQIDFSSYATNTNLTTNYYNKTDADARYLRVSGGTLTGNLNIQNGFALDISGGSGDGKIYRPDGNLRIEFDDILNFRSTFANNTIVFNQGSVSVPNAISSGGSATSAKYIVSGETYSFNANWNSTGSSGWFVPLNPYWSSGHAYLTVAIYLVNAGGSNAYCWFGRVLCSTNINGTSPATSGGIIQITTDYRNPSTASTNNYYIYVKEKWDGSGNNTLWIEVNNFTFGGNIKVKIYG